MWAYHALALEPIDGAVDVAEVEAFLAEQPYVRRWQGSWYVALRREDTFGAPDEHPPRQRAPHLTIEPSRVTLICLPHDETLGRARNIFEWLLTRNDWHVTTWNHDAIPATGCKRGRLSASGMLDALFGPLIRSDPYPTGTPVEAGSLIWWSRRVDGVGHSLYVHDSGAFEHRCGERRLLGHFDVAAGRSWRGLIDRFEEPEFDPEPLRHMEQVVNIELMTPDDEDDDERPLMATFDDQQPPPTLAALHALAADFDARLSVWRENEPPPAGVVEVKVAR